MEDLAQMHADSVIVASVSVGPYDSYLVEEYGSSSGILEPSVSSFSYSPSFLGFKRTDPMQFFNLGSLCGSNVCLWVSASVSISYWW